MSEVVLNVDDSGAHIVSAGSEFSGVYRMHSGAMPEPISVAPGGENRVLVCAAARAGAVLVTIVYGDESIYEDQSWEVFPGAPLKVLSNETPAEVTFEQVGSELPQVELLVADSGVAVPELEFLVLNAGTGVRLGSASASDVVLGWRDTRPLSGAPEEFTSYAFITNGGAEFIDSDPDFNGRPSVAWTEEQAGGYRYSGSVAGLWDFLGAGGASLVMAIIKPPRDRGWGGLTLWRRVSGDGPALDLSIDGGYRVALGYYDDEDVSPSIELTSRDEIIEDGTSMVLILLKNESGVQLYRQGAWELLDDDVTGTTPPTPTDALPMLGIPSSGGVQTNLKIADFRIWKELPSDLNETIDEYIEMAVTEYGVDDSVRPGFPWVTGADVMLRANRGVVHTDESIIYLPGDPTMAGSAVQGWGDTRTEGEADFFGPRPDGEQTYPSLETSDELSGHDVVRSYGATGTVEGTIVGHSLEETSADAALPLYSSEFTLGFISVPTDDEGPNRGGIIIATNSSAGPTDVFVWRLTSSGQLYLLITADGETDLEVTLEIGTQVFERPYAFMARLGNGSVKLEAWDLSDEDSHFELAEPTTWAGTNPPDHLVLFDYPAYYNASQFFDGKSAELFMHPDRVPDSEVRNWISYARRRYLEVDWSSV